MTLLLTSLAIFCLGVVSHSLMPTHHRVLYVYWANVSLVVLSMMLLVSLCS